MEKWIIGRGGSMLDDVTTEVIEGSREQVKAYLCGLVNKDKNTEYDDFHFVGDWNGGTELPKDVEEMNDGRLYAKADWENCHNDYTATPYDGKAKVLGEENSLNAEEKKLASKLIRISEKIPDGKELEMDLLDSGWYAYMYNGNEAVPINDKYREKPVITEKQARKKSIDVYKVFNHIGCSYCG